MTPEPFSLTSPFPFLGMRTRARRIAAKPQKPEDHHHCSIHPHRWLRGSERGPIEPCWQCQREGDSPLMDNAAFDAIDELIGLGLEQIPQDRITPEMIERARAEAQLSWLLADEESVSG